MVFIEPKEEDKNAILESKQNCSVNKVIFEINQLYLLDIDTILV